ncbi:Pvc16 family protein [Flindersiella endophytica]
MSNYLAIAQASEALKLFVQRSVIEDTGFQVDVLVRKPPAEPFEQPTITIFLYQISPNSSLRNQDAPTRDAGGALLRTPQAAVDLHYILSFYGNEAELQPLVLLGSAVRALYSEPMLSRADIEQAASAVYLVGGDLAASAQPIRFTPTKLDIDDLSKLWSTLTLTTPYATSVVYEATLVLLDGRGAPKAGRPVLARNIRVVPRIRPIVNRVLTRDPASTEQPSEGPVPRGNEVHLIGTDLTADDVQVAIHEHLVTPSDVRDDRVLFTPDDTLSPGVYPVRVIHQIGFNGTSRRLDSNVSALIRQPTVESASLQGGVVTVRLDLPVRRDQRVVLLLDSLDAPPERPVSYQFKAAFPLPDAADDRQAAVRVLGVGAGTYLVRATVDGVESRSDFANPTVTF